MKKWFLHILLLAGLFGVLTTSCSQDEDDPTQISDSRKAQVVFTIALNSQSSGSRGTWGDNYDNSNTNNYESAIGDDFDNRINPDQFYVQITTDKGTYNVENVVYTQTSTNNNVYEFFGEVEVEASSTSAKIMVFANMDPDDNGSFNVPFNKNTAFIPMFGVQTVNLALTPGARFELIEPIYLLRAMAKVEVELAANVIEKGYTLTNVSLNRHNTKGNCLPKNWNTVPNTKTLTHDAEDCFNPNATDASSTSLAFSITDNHLVFYLPEVSNTADTNELKMEVTLKKGNKTINLKTPYLYFRKYNNSGSAENAQRFNIVRNHWYKYNITAVKDDFSLALTCVVQDWQLVEESWDFTDHVYLDDEGELKFGTYTNGVFEPSTETASEVVTFGEDLFCQFGIATPEDAIWRAEFISVSGDKNPFVFVSVGENGQEITSATMEGEVGSLARLTIRPANANIKQNNSAVLRISVKTVDNRTIVVKNLVPNSLDATEYTITHSK